MAASTSIEGVPLPEAFRKTAAEHGEHPAVVFAGRTVRFSELNDTTDRIATALAERGLRKGDRVGLYCINSDAFAAAYFGLLKAGAAVVPINLLLSPREISFILADAGARGLVYHEAFSAAAAAATPAVPSLEFGVCVGRNRAREGDVLFPSLLSAPADPPRVDIDPAEDLAAILYTSGTTGRPKGAMLTHRNLYVNTLSIGEALRLVPGEDVFLTVLPMFHAFAATVCLLFPLLHGCTTVALPRFEPRETADAIAAHGVTILPAVPSMYNLLLRLPDEYTPKFASLKFGVSGGAALPVEVMKQFEARFGKVIYEGDGPTECSPVTCVNPIGGRRKAGSVGLPVPHVEMRIMDDAGRPVSRGQIGEICVRGPNVMKGYWNLPDDTAAAFFGEWFRTGDLGSQDEDGYFYIVDRKKDMIIVNGMNVYPRMVEEVLYQHEAVREAAIVGEPHPLHGEVPVAFVSLRDGAEATAARLRAFCRRNLGRHEVPRRFAFLPDLPKNAAGKINKRELRRQGEIERGVDAAPED